MNFNSILIGSESPKRLVDYYTRLFGQATMSDGDYTGWLIGSGFVTIGPHSDLASSSWSWQFGKPATCSERP